MSEAKVSTRRLRPDEACVAEAARLLAAGGLVAFPTETVYGLGADATDARAVARLFAAKGRPSFNPLIAHVADVKAARRAGKLSPLAEKLAEAFWPGPLTLVVEARDVVCELARAGLATVALRVPKHPVAQALLAAFAKPIAAPSANRSGHVSPTTAEHVLADLEGFVDLVVDGGPTPLGLESTIVDVSGEAPRLLRSGGIPRADIERVLGTKLLDGDKKVRAPGMLKSHYATRARLRLDARDVRPGEAALAFGAGGVRGEKAAAQVLNLSPSGNLVEAAANLFGHLRALDATGVATIAVAPIPVTGLGEAINDRLKRAAAPR